MMRMLRMTAAAGALTLALAGCYDDDANYSDNAYNAAEANYDANATEYAGAEGGTYAWPEGARIVVEDGVTYRIDSGGARVALGPSDSRIEVIDGVRFRVDPGGTRVRIDEQGVAVRVDSDGVDATVPVDENISASVNSN